MFEQGSLAYSRGQFKRETLGSVICTVLNRHSTIMHTGYQTRCQRTQNIVAVLPVKVMNDPAAASHPNAGACGLTIWPLSEWLDQCRMNM